MKRLAFIVAALGHLTDNKATLELPEQEGLQQILEDIYISQK